MKSYISVLEIKIPELRGETDTTKAYKYLKDLLGVKASDLNRYSEDEINSFSQFNAKYKIQIHSYYDGNTKVWVAHYTLSSYDLIDPVCECIMNNEIGYLKMIELVEITII